MEAAVHPYVPTLTVLDDARDVVTEEDVCGNCSRGRQRNVAKYKLLRGYLSDRCFTERAKKFGIAVGFVVDG